MALRSLVRIDAVKNLDGRQLVQIHASHSILKPQLQRFWKDCEIAISETGQGFECYLRIERFPCSARAAARACGSVPPARINASISRSSFAGKASRFERPSTLLSPRFVFRTVSCFDMPTGILIPCKGYPACRWFRTDRRDRPPQDRPKRQKRETPERKPCLARHQSLTQPSPQPSPAPLSGAHCPGHRG